MKVRMLQTDNHPSGVQRYVKGDEAEVLHHQQRLTIKNPFNFYVKLPRRVYIGEGENKRGLSTLAYFNNNQVEIV